MKRWISISLLFVCLSADAAPETLHFDSNGMTGVLIKNPSGKILIQSHPGGKTQVRVTRHHFSDHCKMDIDRSASQIMIEVQARQGAHQKEPCEVDFDLQVPRSVNLDLTLGSGQLLIQGIQGEFTFQIGSGDLFAQGGFKNVHGSTGSGNIRIEGLTGDGSLKTGSGNIRLKYLSKSLFGKLDLKTGSGDATLIFPKETRLRSHFQAGSGRLVNELGNFPDSKFEIVMNAGSGNLTIQSY